MMAWRNIMVLIAALVATSFALPASAQRGLTITAKQLQEMRTEKRVALVIGNSNYSTSRLRNPVTDAMAMTLKLRSLGFEVTEKLDVDCQRRSKNPPVAGVKVHHHGDVEPFHLS